jgi:ADP-heptose synthase, bifunctional sugar kinase/adenylyltransferase
MIVELEELLELLEKVRGKKKIVFTNGCFDILHAGHADYLNKAKSLGDILVVGINSDASVRRIKGEKRPILPQQMRAYLLDNLKPVDYVVIFEEDTPWN